jgi:hypothetical protein
MKKILVDEERVKKRSPSLNLCRLTQTSLAPTWLGKRETSQIPFKIFVPFSTAFPRRVILLENDIFLFFIFHKNSLGIVSE